MSERDEVQLDAEARALLDAFHADEQLPDDVRDRVWHRLDRSRARGLGRAAMIVLAAAAAIALVVLGRDALESRERKQPTHEQAPYVEQRDDAGATAVVHEAARAVAPPGPTAAQAPGVAPPETAPVQADAGAPALPERKPAKPRATAPAVAPAEATPAEPDDPLAAEAELLRRARAALSRGEPRDALSLLEQAAQHFRPGVLGEERDALRVLALCDAGERAKARERAEAFLRAHPGSPLAERVDAACAEP